MLLPFHSHDPILRASLGIGGVLMNHRKHRKKATQCERRDLNPHTFRYQILSLARLPIPPLALDILWWTVSRDLLREPGRLDVSVYKFEQGFVRL